MYAPRKALRPLSSLPKVFLKIKKNIGVRNTLEVFMDQSVLIAHVDSGKVLYEELGNYNAPEATGRWKPVPHLALVDALKNQINANYRIAREEYAVSNNGFKLFGIMDLESELVPGMTKSIGFRHGNDKALAIQIVAGGRVFCCDNLALHGSMVVLKAKHTWGFNLNDRISVGLEKWEKDVVVFREKIETLAERTVTDHEAQALLAKTLYDGTITFQTFKVAYDLYFDRAVKTPDQYPDCAPRTVWGLHNALTRAFKLSTPNIQFTGTIAVSRELGLS